MQFVICLVSSEVFAWVILSIRCHPMRMMMLNVG